MARFNPHEKSAALYPVVSEFADRCLLQDGSILQPDLRLWTAENLAELDRTFVQNPDEGTVSLDPTFLVLIPRHYTFRQLVMPCMSGIWWLTTDRRYYH